MNRVYFRCILGLLLFLSYLTANGAVLKGKILDKKTNEPLIGATIKIEELGIGIGTNIDGDYRLENIKPGIYTLVAQYISYETVTIKNYKIESEEQELNIKLKEEELTLKEVTVVARARHNTENAMLRATKRSLIVQSGVSSQEIQRAQDSDASEVIRRVPGISLIDEKFIMVRGLSQRYNNVWINGSGVPGTEADSRAFSFDIIPGSQLDNMQIVKSPTPEYPSDFTGGFVLIKTKEMPNENSLKISFGNGLNTTSHFNTFLYNKGSKTDFLGFDSGKRRMKDGIFTKLKGIDTNGTDLLNNGFNNDWTIKKITPLPNMNFNLSFNRFHKLESGKRYSLLGTLNYSRKSTSFLDMTNSLFGAYDVSQGQSSYLRKSKDNQYNINVRIGAMLNFTYDLGNGNLFEFRNIFNQLGKNRYTHRVGVNAQSNLEESAEYYYSSRTIYNGQLTGKHSFSNGKFSWSTGYAFANRLLPDRKRYLRDDALESGVIALTTGNDINREYTELKEHIVSLNMNYEHNFNFSGFKPTLKTGIYTEYRNRKYNARSFIYNWNYSNNDMPKGFRTFDIPTELMKEENYGISRLYLLEEIKMRNNYEGKNNTISGYLATNLPFGKVNIYTGLRYEFVKMELIGNSKDYEPSPISTILENKDLFPSINATYKFNEEHQLRASFGKSINRPEFREVSSSVFYDFDLASSVQGNPNIKSCYVNNEDIRYEFYPDHGEIISLALFGKQFKNPIEWTYTVTGGTDLVYSFQNANKAYSYGIELDLRKRLDFIGLKNVSISFNGTLIHSKVQFPKGSLEKNRPMQGQSPYLINFGMFYGNAPLKLNVNLLYNRIGKRIVGVGRSIGSIGGEETINIPDSYEMPRNVIDLNISKKFGDHWELKCSLRDLLAEKVSYKQFDTVKLATGEKIEIKQITKEYNPGRTIRVSVGYNF